MMTHEQMIRNNVIEALEQGARSPGAVCRLTGHAWNKCRDVMIGLEKEGVCRRKVKFREYSFRLVKKQTPKKEKA